MTIWQGMHRKRWRFSPKDVGHERATLQPFQTDNRDWEVELSTLLMLHVSEQVKVGGLTSRFVVQEERDRLDADIATKSSTQPIHEDFNRAGTRPNFYDSGSPAPGVDKALAGGVETRSYGAAL